jgi:hypothetical protein
MGSTNHKAPQCAVSSSPPLPPPLSAQTSSSAHLSDDNLVPQAIHSPVPLSQHAGYTALAVQTPVLLDASLRPVIVTVARLLMPRGTLRDAHRRVRLSRKSR